LPFNSLQNLLHEDLRKKATFSPTVVRSVVSDGNTPFGSLKYSVPRRNDWKRGTIVMDTMTYASVAALAWSIAKDCKKPVVSDPEFIALDLSLINR
jgi:hypothetical protein